ncbi:MAG: elongation factor Ts [Hyphomicrobiaceae bacterium]|nr:elongation factor Ts [Hyphomicrobiaceae bacterium]
MTTISAAMVKELRDKTGAGMMDCKQALIENNGDIEASVDWLRKKGLSKAAKKSGRVAAEGLIGVAVEGQVGAMVEVNSETDFVARNAQFQGMVSQIARLALKAGGDLARLLSMPFPGKTVSVEDHVKEMIATIGENMSVRRTAEVCTGADGVIVDYVHNRVAAGLGKLGVLVTMASAGDKARLAEFGRQIAMHIAAAAPLAVTADDLDPAVIERERQIYLEQAKASGKPQDIIEKMAEGRLRKEFFQQVVLMQQIFVVDGKSTVEQAVKDAAGTVGAPVRITGFVRYALGEGIERKEEDFAAEVAAAVSGTR